MHSHLLGVEPFLVLGAGLFCLGVCCLLTRRSVIGIAMGIELVVNGANVNLVAFAFHLHGDAAGQVFALMGIVLAAIEVSVALAIVFALHRVNDRRISLDDATTLRG